MKRIAAISLMVILLTIPLMAVNCGSDGDTTPPEISDITASYIIATQAEISWNTDEPATSNIEYGPDTSYGYSVPSPADTTANTTSHNWILNQLTSYRTYHFRIISTDDAGNEAVSEDHSFTPNLLAYANGVAWNSHSTPPNMKADQTYTIDIVITNTSNLAWPASGPNPFLLSYHWKIAGGDYVVWDGLKSSLEANMAPGESTTVSATVAAPSSPGSYILAWDMAQEGITWFSAAECPTLDVLVQVTI